ncbi:sensor histidine kinase [Thermodesulfobacteriota bacterium]
MVQRASYQELQTRIKALEEEAKERQRAEASLRQRTFELGERIKELNCLYNISQVLEIPHVSLSEILQNIVELIPPALQFPEITCARIIIDNKGFETGHFRETHWKLTDDIIVHNQKSGSLDICYLEERAERDEGPFLKEERILLHMITERLGNVIERKKAEKQVRLLTQQIIRAQESERQMISRELHDRLAQDLSTLKIIIETLFDNYPDVSSQIRIKVSEMSEMLQRTIMAVRDLSYELRPPSLDDLGLIQAVYQFVEDFSEKTGIDVEFTSAGLDEVELDFDTKINLYRLVQEGLNNVLKHADASHIVLKMITSPPNIMLRIEDNGNGFDVKKRLATMDNEKRMGLRSMEERVRLLGGRMNIQSQLGKGTKIFIEAPIKE